MIWFSFCKYIYSNEWTALVVAYNIAQGVLEAVVSAALGNRDPEQVNKIARQAGEVWKTNHF